MRLTHRVCPLLLHGLCAIPESLLLWPGEDVVDPETMVAEEEKEEQTHVHHARNVFQSVGPVLWERPKSDSLALHRAEQEFFFILCCFCFPSGEQVR